MAVDSRIKFKTKHDLDKFSISVKITSVANFVNYNMAKWCFKKVKEHDFGQLGISLENYCDWNFINQYWLVVFWIKLECIGCLNSWLHCQLIQYCYEVVYNKFKKKHDFGHWVWVNSSFELCQLIILQQVFLQ